MTILETIAALKFQQSRANNGRVGVRSLSRKVSSVGLSSVSTNLTERKAFVGVGVGIGVGVGNILTFKDRS
jgi:hypothetical protein